MTKNKKIKCIVEILLVSALLLVISLMNFIYSVLKFDGIADAFRDNGNIITVIIDPGHGGADGGAETGTVAEKDINLEISLKLAKILELYNVDVVLTRDGDYMLASDTSKNKKSEDLKNRVKLTQEYESPIFVSIHTNKFSVEKYRGLQVFYSPNTGHSESLALIIQKNTNHMLQSAGNRNVKKADSSIYVLDRTFCPSVLVECGFLSNPDDLKLLTDDNYQMQLAFIIANSIIEYIEL